MNNSLFSKIKSKYLIPISILIIIIIAWGSGYHSVETKSEEDIEQYLKNYLKEKYNADCDLKYENKVLTEFCVATFDGCYRYARNKNIYDHIYTGTDKYNRQFSIEYTDSYMKNFKIQKGVVIEDYKEYADQEYIQNLLTQEYVKYSKYSLNMFIAMDKSFNIKKAISTDDEIRKRLYKHLLIITNNNDSFYKISGYNFIPEYYEDDIQQWFDGIMLEDYELKTNNINDISNIDTNNYIIIMYSEDNHSNILIYSK